jgi:hypothetical protein
MGLLLVWKFGERYLGDQEHQARVEIFILLLLSGLAGLNFQVLSGYDAQHTHFWNRLILPVAFFLCGCWLLSAIENPKRHRLRVFDGAALGILVCILLNSGVRQVCVGARIAGQQRASRPELELLMWVRSNLPVGSVIGTVDPDLILMIPAVGPNFTYVPAGLRSLTPTSEIVDRYYELASLLGLSTPEVESITTSAVHHSQDSQLLWVLMGMELWNTGRTPRTFSEGYRQYGHEQAQVDRLRRLDYVVSRPGMPIPAGIAENFIHAQVLHVNQRYQLIGLRDQIMQYSTVRSH